MNRDDILTLLPEAGQDEEFDTKLDEALTAIRATHAGVNVDDVRVAIGVMLANERGVSIEQAFKKVASVPEEETVISFDAVDKIADSNEAFYEPKDVTEFLDLWIQLRRRYNNVGVVVAKGPSGCGKTEGFIQLAKRTNTPVLVWNCGIVTSPEKWLGHKEIDENGTRYEKSQFVKRLEGIEEPPGLIVLDEINRVPPSMNNLLMSVLDGRQEIHIPEIGETIRVHPDVIFAATMNEGNGFGGTFKLDAALAERMPYTIPRDFPPTDDEIALAMARTGVSQDKAERMVWVANHTREMWRRDEIERPISTRLLLKWALLVAAGMPIGKAAEFSVLGQYRADGGEAGDLRKVRNAVQGKAGA